MGISSSHESTDVVSDSISFLLVLVGGICSLTRGGTTFLLANILLGAGPGVVVRSRDTSRGGLGTG